MKKFMMIFVVSMLLFSPVKVKSQTDVEKMRIK